MGGKTVKNKGFKILGLYLALVMLAAAFAGCQNKTPSDTTGQSDTTDTTVSTSTNLGTDKWGQDVIKTEIPDDLDYGGREVIIAIRPESRYAKDIQKKEDPTDTVDEKTVLRNRSVEKQIGVTLKMVYKTELWGGFDVLTPLVTTAYLSNLNEFNVVCAYAAYATSPVLRSCYIDLNDQKVKYLNPEKGYWNQSYVSAATYQNSIYYIVGDMSLSVYDRSIVTYANLTLLENNGITDLYKTVLEGKWTIDLFLQYIKALGYTDTDNSGNISAGDTVALSSIHISEFADGWVSALGLDILPMKNDGTLAFDVVGNTKLETAKAKVSELKDTTGVYLYTVNGLDAQRRMFTNGRSAFSLDMLCRSEAAASDVKAMTDKYAILPLPKYDEEQATYMTTPQDSYNLIAIMNTGSTHKESVSATLELLAAKSYEDVRPFYMESALKISLAQSDTSDAYKVMALVLDGISFDRGTVFAPQLNGGMKELWRSAITKDSSISQVWATRSSACEEALETFVNWYVFKTN